MSEPSPFTASQSTQALTPPVLVILRQARLLRVLRVLKLLKASQAATHYLDDVWLPLSLFVSVAASGWLVDDTIQRSTLTWAPVARQLSAMVFAAATWMSGAYFANRLLRVVLWNTLIPRHTGRAVSRLIHDTAGAIVYLGAVAGVASHVLHLPLTGVWAAAGALSVVLGLALRNIILDLFVGFALSVDHSFKIGDFVQIQHNDIIGQGVEINWRTTHLLTIDANVVVIPNSRIGDMVVTNYSAPDALTVVNSVVWVDDAHPCDQVEQALSAAVKAV